MQDQRIRITDSNPAQEDRDAQGAVLVHLLYLHPAQTTVEEIVREIAGDPDEFGDRDQIERAIRDLTRVGLLHRNGRFVVPARPAVHFDGLEIGSAA